RGRDGVPVREAGDDPDPELLLPPLRSFLLVPHDDGDRNEFQHARGEAPHADKVGWFTGLVGPFPPRHRARSAPYAYRIRGRRFSTSCRLYSRRISRASSSPRSNRRHSRTASCPCKPRVSSVRSMPSSDSIAFNPPERPREWSGYRRSAWSWSNRSCGHHAWRKGRSNREPLNLTINGDY